MSNTDSNDWLDEILNRQRLKTYMERVVLLGITDYEQRAIKIKSDIDEYFVEAKQAIQSKVDEMVREARIDEIAIAMELDETELISSRYLPNRLAQLSTNKSKGEV